MNTITNYLTSIETVVGAVTVEDRDALDLLPAGTKLRGVGLGDDFVKQLDGTYVIPDTEHDPFESHELILPKIITNPEVLDDEYVTRHGFTLGDKVQVTTNEFPSSPVGTIGTIVGFSRPYVKVLHDGVDQTGYYFPHEASEIELCVEPVDDGLSVGDYAIVTDPKWGHGFAAGTRVRLIQNRAWTEQAWTCTTLPVGSSEDWFYGVTGYCAAVELTRVDEEFEAVPDSELLGAFIGCRNGLDTLGDGSVVQRAFSSATYFKRRDNWYHVLHGIEGSATFNLAVGDAVESRFGGQGLIVLHAA